MNCEIHLTFHISHADKVHDACPHGWKFSKILNDPVMGDHPFCYLTTYAEDAKSAFAKIDLVKLSVPVQVLREKIEVIIHDRRFK
jgi:hypothetical protein